MIEFVAATLGLALISDETAPASLSTSPGPVAGRRTEGGLVLRPISEWGCGVRFGASWKPHWISDLSWAFMDRRTKRMFTEEFIKNAQPWYDGFEWNPEWVELEVEWDDEEDAYIDPNTGEEYDEPPAYWEGAHLAFQANTWPAFDLFPGLQPMTGKPTMALLDGRHPESDTYTARSPDGRWVYLNRVLKRGKSLSLHRFDDYEDRVVEGSVVFDGPVTIPIIYERQPSGNYTLWMSQTPFEVLTQKPASDRAKGKTIVAGLGMGWMLARVANNPKVTEVVLVERDQGLVDWILPRLCTLLPKDKPIHVVVGDMYEVLPKLQADSALLDIWPTYTEVSDEVQDLMAESPLIEYFWAWGMDWEPNQLWSNPAHRRWRRKR